MFQTYPQSPPSLVSALRSGGFWPCGFWMAKFFSPQSSSALPSPRALLPIPKPLFPTTLVPIVFSVSCSISIDERYPSLQINCSARSHSSSTEFPQPPSTVVFIKGLALSTSEGSLKKAFSQFGEVSRTKIVTDKKTKQSLGSAFVWFTSEESAKLAVKEMDGKFFEGRFIYVTISKPGACKTSGRPTPYKF